MRGKEGEQLDNQVNSSRQCARYPGNRGSGLHHGLWWGRRAGRQPWTRSRPDR